jgi:hypothetical protein
MSGPSDVTPSTAAFAARVAEAIEDSDIGVGDAFRLWARGDRPAIRPATLLAKELEEWFAGEQPDLTAQLADLQATFDLRWKADMRAIKSWQEAHSEIPRVSLIWPDHVDLVLWLEAQLEQERAKVAALVEALETVRTASAWRDDLGLQERLRMCLVASRAALNSTDKETQG